MFAPNIPIPLEDLMGWLKSGINPTCKWAAEVIEQQQAEIERQRGALALIEQWTLPETGEFWDREKTQSVSYGAQYGSNGERDYMRAIARAALT